MRRMGSLAQDCASVIHIGSKRSYTFRSAAESARSRMTVAEFGPGSPPNNRIVDVLKAESVCQASEGPSTVVELDELLVSSHGGDEASNEADKGRYRRSFEVGAEVYEYELNGSVLPPWINNASFTTTAAWPHRGTAVYWATTPRASVNMQSVRNK